MHAHPAGALDEGLDDDAGDVVGAMGAKAALERAVAPAPGAAGESRRSPLPANARVHAVDRIAQRHRGERVAVVRALERDDGAPRARRALWNDCSAIFSATSTATEPLSVKKT